MVRRRRPRPSCRGASYAVDVAVECTGKFRTADTAGGHLEAGARKVVISAPGKGVDATFVMGINDDDYDPRHHDVVSNASCTTNCVAPMVKVLHDAFGVQQGFMTHRARLHRRPEPARRPAQGPAPGAVGGGQHHPDHHRRGAAPSARSCPSWPASSTASRCACRSSTARWSTWRCCSTARSRWPRSTPPSRPPPQRRSSRGRLRYEDEPFVSVDVIGDPASCVFDSSLTQAVRQLREGLRLVRQRVGLHRSARSSWSGWSARTPATPSAP